MKAITPKMRPVYNLSDSQIISRLESVRQHLESANQELENLMHASYDALCRQDNIQVGALQMCRLNDKRIYADWQNCGCLLHDILNLIERARFIEKESQTSQIEKEVRNVV